MRRTMRNVFAALRPGEVFIFDVRHPADHDIPPRYHHKAAKDWLCYCRIDEDFRQNKLLRYITTFRKAKNGYYRRDDEDHQLKVFPQTEVAGWLRKIGFRVRTRRSYGDYELRKRQSVFICRKPNS